jgi:hypothetical protein
MNPWRLNVPGGFSGVELNVILKLVDEHTCPTAAFMRQPTRAESGNYSSFPTIAGQKVA